MGCELLPTNCFARMAHCNTECFSSHHQSQGGKRTRRHHEILLITLLRMARFRAYNALMEHIGTQLAKIERNIKLDGFDRISSAGFTMYPNAIQNDPNLELGEKAVYAQFLQ